MGDTAEITQPKTEQVPLEDSFFYENPVTVLQSAKEMESSTIAIDSSFGFDSHKRSNIFYITESVLLTSVGNLLHFIDLETLNKTHLKGFRHGGIGAIAIHPLRTFIAIAEIHPDPLIYILEYPSLKVHRILRNGAVAGYSNICFNSKGDKLASVGTDPDYMLTIWNWKQEAVILRSKAFSQDVYRVAFADESDGILVTSGVGHIKFWRMNLTFTGLKLQGYLGKFGATELTDINAFAQLPDGKVLSSTETGNLLLWDGGIIKFELSAKGKKPCHIGRIEIVILTDGEILTSGEDGYIRMWDLEVIDNADITSSAGEPVQTSLGSRIFEMEPLDEILIGKDVKIKSLIRNPVDQDEYIIQDLQGNLFKLDTKMRTVEKFMNFHSGPILGADTSPVTHSAVSLGKDGSVRLYDYRNKKMVFKSHYPSGGSFIRYLPKSINGYGDTIIAGFEDGVLRIVSHDQISSPEVKFSLHYVFKAHKLPIRDIVFSYETDYFATTCSDKTVFFFHIKKLEGYEVTPRFNRQSVLVKPLGFVNLEQSVKSLSFIPDEEGVKSNGEIRCLVVFDEGELATLRIPTQKKIDSNISFEYQSDEVKIIGWKFSVPEVKIAAPVKKETDVKEGKAEEPAVAPVEVIKPIGPILQIQMSSLFQRVLFTEAGNFIAVVTNNVGQSEVRLCKLSTPNISRLLLVHSMPISDVKFSKSGKFLLFGGKDGMACLRKFQFDDVLIRESDQGHEIYQNESKTNESIVSEGNSVENYWNGFAHDCQRGSVTGISNSFDDSYMVTSGLDGGLVFWRNISQQISHVDGLLILILESNFQTETAPVQARQEDDEEEEDVVVSKPKIDNTVIDIVDPQYYTIQEERMKSELDREIQNAEVKKQVTRLYVQDLRTEFLKIIAENESANPDWRLPRDSLIVDSDLASDIGLFTLTIEKVTQVKIETVHKDMKWISEKERIGLEKMKAKFLDDIYIDRIEISSFRCDHKLATFRTLNLNSFRELSLGLTNETFVEKQTDSDNKSHNKQITGEGPDEGHNAKGTYKAAKNKMEARKQLRAERAQLWKELLESKPDENYEDPRDIAAIRFAETHLGDYKLKTGERYIVPESERVDADKKRRQLVLLNQSIFNLKENFNKQVIALRDNKQYLLRKFEEYLRNIEDINKELYEMGETIETFNGPPKMDARAYPENRFIVTDDDIENEKKSLVDYANLVENSKNTSKPSTASSDYSVSKTAALKPTSKGILEREKDILMKSSIELKEFTNRGIKLRYKKDRYLKSIDQALVAFDQKIENLAKEKILLAGDIKFADIKLLLLYREWVLLKEFEKYDTDLADKLVLKRQEQYDIDNKLKECQEKLAVKKLEIEQILKKEREIQEEFQKTLGEANKHEEYLTRVLRKKIKRSKKKQKTESNRESDENDDEESEESEDSYDSAEDGDDEIEVEDDICPPDCDVSIFNRVLELREQKLDSDDMLMEIQKAIEALRKENESLIKKEKVIHVSLKNTEASIEDFQTQKQQKLNELDVIVPLRLHQLQYLENNALPADLSSALVFVEDGLRVLKGRIKELHEEKIDIKKSHWELKKMHVSLVKSRKEKQRKLEDLDRRAYEVQMLKFGKVIDLDKLERMGVNKNAEELREKLLKDDLRRTQELNQAQKEIDKRKERLDSVIKENTSRLDKIVELRETDIRLEESLNAGQSAVAAEYNGPMKKDIQERERLLKLIHVQGNEIEELKGEIEMLVRKPNNR